MHSRCIGLPGVPAGIHHFVVVVDDPPINIVPHRYKIGRKGFVINNDYGLTETELADYENLAFLAGWISILFSTIL